MCCFAAICFDLTSNSFAFCLNKIKSSKFKKNSDFRHFTSFFLTRNDRETNSVLNPIVSQNVYFHLFFDIFILNISSIDRQKIELLNSLSFFIFYLISV